MRPVVKWEVGTNGVVEDYNPFQTAKPKLAENLGDFCSYCDRKLAVIALEVEHVHPKSIEEYASLKFKWENFLLACKNCNLVKDNNDLDFATTLFPHVHNTYAVFSVNQSGYIVPRNGLGPTEIAIAEKSIKDFGLNRKEGECGHTPADDRFKYRRDALNLANRYLEKFKVGSADLETILDLALTSGFWLVWMEVFANFPDIQNALIIAFPSTYQRCMELPIIRNS